MGSPSGDFWYTGGGSDLRDWAIGNGAQLLDALARRNAAVIREHPFVRRCAAGRTSLHALRIFLGQHGKYGAHFIRCLCAVIANLDDCADVAPLTRKLAEELGYGHGREESHSAMYARMLADFDVDPKRTPTLPGTQTLIDTMSGYCKREHLVYGLAALCLGAEAIVPALYADIMAGFAACGAAPEQLAFFRVHIACGDVHGQAMRDILVRMLDEDPGLRDAVHEAATKTISARLDFFTNLDWEAA
jgi:pyrroloquinoline quinone (PQQ) biosynthesis protein C